MRSTLLIAVVGLTFALSSCARKPSAPAPTTATPGATPAKPAAAPSKKDLLMGKWQSKQDENTTFLVEFKPDGGHESVTKGRRTGFLTKEEFVAGAKPKPVDFEDKSSGKYVFREEAMELEISDAGADKKSEKMRVLRLTADEMEVSPLDLPPEAKKSMVFKRVK